MRLRIGGRVVMAIGAAGLVGLTTPAVAQQPTRSPGEATERGAGSSQPLGDAWLTAKTKLALMADEDVSGAAINVDTANAIVTLKGEVDSQAAKAKAVEIARGIEGVEQVRDQLTLRTTQSGGGASGARQPVKRDDEEIARQVRQAIQQHWAAGRLQLDGDTLKGPEDTEIEVAVDDGIVTLEGRVQRVEDIVSAAQAARRVQGVRSVKTAIESGQPS